MTTGVLVLAGCSVVPDNTGVRHHQAAETSSTTSSMKYVSLGSSYVTGPGGGHYAGGKTARRCGRTTNDYPREVAAAAKGRLRLVDNACSGAVTRDLTHPAKHPVNNPPQIDAVTPDTRLVTITVGGNDIDYVGRVISMSCANSDPERGRTIAPRTCARDGVPSPEPEAAAYSLVEQRLVAAVEAIRTRAPHAVVMLVDYPPAVAKGDRGCALLPLSPDEIDQTLRVENALAGATAKAARRTGVELVTASLAGEAHDVCSPDPWVTGFAKPVPFHPNESGKRGVAQLIITKLGSRLD